MMRILVLLCVGLFGLMSEASAQFAVPSTAGDFYCYNQAGNPNGGATQMSMDSCVVQEIWATYNSDQCGPHLGNTNIEAGPDHWATSTIQGHTFELYDKVAFQMPCLSVMTAVTEQVGYIAHALACPPQPQIPGTTFMNSTAGSTTNGIPTCECPNNTFGGVNVTQYWQDDAGTCTLSTMAPLSTFDPVNWMDPIPF